MHRSCIFVSLLFISALGFAQPSPTGGEPRPSASAAGSIRIIGRIPSADDSSLYQIQVGAFKIARNAERAFARLSNASLDPIYESYLDFTRVMIAGIRARDVPFYLEEIKRAGFS